MLACVYKITNLINNKVYIGKTVKPINIRFREHCNAASRLLVKSSRRECRMPIVQAIATYGRNNFTIEIIESCENEILALEREKHWIKLLNTNDRNIGYNLDLGGLGVSMPKTEEWKKKISNSHMGKVCPEELKRYYSELYTGRKNYEGTRKMIESNNEKFKKLKDEFLNKVIYLRNVNTQDVIKVTVRDSLAILNINDSNAKGKINRVTKPNNERYGSSIGFFQVWFEGQEPPPLKDINFRQKQTGKPKQGRAGKGIKRPPEWGNKISKALRERD